MIDGNDGGLNITHDRGKTWRFVENLPVGQFYHINVDNDFPYNVYGGLQDNGSWAGPAYVLKDQGIRNSYWQEIQFGDGFDAIPDPKDSRFGYSMSQQGFVTRYDKVTGNSKVIRPTHPNPAIKLRFNWNSAIAMNPIDNETIHFGSQFVHKSTNKGHTWEIISPDLTTNNPEKQKQHESGGITMDATGAENHCTILAIEPSTFDENILWVGTDDGNIQLTQDGGKTWENLVANKDETFGYTLSFIQDLEVPNLQFLGTEYGLYVSIDEGKNWTKWNGNYPNVSTMDLTIQPREHDLVIGTFGRAIYVLDDIRPLRAIAKEGKQLLDKKIHLFTPPTAFITETQQPSGTRFGANAIFNGENKNGGAMITYSINKPEIKKTEETLNKKNNKSTTETAIKGEKTAVKFDTIFFEVYNDKNELIRSIKYKVPKENGLHRMYWQLEEKGTRGPSRRKVSEKVSEPSGVTVLPGNYTIKLHFGNETVSEKIEVKYDPRIGISFEVLKSKYNLLKALENKIGIAGDASQRLLASKEIVEDYQKRIIALKTDKFEDLLKNHKEIITKINGLLDDLLGKEDDRQGITDTEFPSTISYLYTARSYVNSLQQLPGLTETTLIKIADEKVEEVISKINEFYKSDWISYKDSVKDLKLSPFTDIEEFKYE
jgi:hypothetical protein